jgi:hypothetical protein
MKLKIVKAIAWATFVLVFALRAAWHIQAQDARTPR